MARIPLSNFDVGNEVLLKIKCFTEPVLAGHSSLELPRNLFLDCIMMFDETDL